MSESVKIGGIGKNPAIDKIHSINSVNIHSYAADRMHQTLTGRKPSSGKGQNRGARIGQTFFDKVDWEGKESGRR